LQLSHAKLKEELALLTAQHQDHKTKAEAALEAAQTANATPAALVLDPQQAASLNAELKATAEKLKKTEEALAKEAADVLSLRDQLTQAASASQAATTLQKTLEEAQSRIQQEAKAKESLVGDLKRMQHVHSELIKKHKELQQQLTEAQKAGPQEKPASANLPSSAPEAIQPTTSTDTNALKAVRSNL